MHGLGSILALIAIGGCACAVSYADEPQSTATIPGGITADLKPLLVEHCQRCHSGDEPQGSLALDALLARGVMIADRPSWASIAERVRHGSMPPEGEPQPTANERAQLLAHVDTALAHLETISKPSAGRVTMRRLNRYEYDNTIRDLVGIDFHPADDFPSDDVGYGFDNIGDVLSLPPILMEKYLAAAEEIVRRGFGDDMPNLLDADKTFGDGPRLLATETELRVKARLPDAGLYVLRVTAHADQAGDDIAKMAIAVDEDRHTVFEVHATENDPQTYEAWIDNKGQHTLAVGFINDYYQPDDPAPNDRNLIVHSWELTGPYPKPLRRWIPRGPTPETKRALARECLTQFATRAFRRQVEGDEVSRLLALFDMADADGERFIASLGVALQAVLVSPHFLFRVEADPPGPVDGERELNDFELATRLSYFLWSSMPDEELFELAISGQLRRGNFLDEQVRRMQADERSAALVEHFGLQWLQLGNLATIAPDRTVYPRFDEPLRRAMRRETELFFEAIVREDRSVLDFVQSDFTFVNERLARHYGLPGVRGEAFRRVELKGRERGGVLTQASVLTVTSNPTRTSPVKRGKWLLENILGTPPPPPPPGVPTLEESAESVAGHSLRAQMEVHRTKAECAVCHSRLDPLGLGLENFDGIGAWRGEEAGAAIDASGTLPGGETFAGPEELKRLLAGRRDEFVHALAERLLTYALGRGVEYSDRQAVDRIVESVQQNDYKFSSLVLAIVASEPFQKRTLNLNQLGDRRP